MAAVTFENRRAGAESLANEAPLHTCPKCKTEWDDEVLVCPEDGTRLTAFAGRAPPPRPAPSSAPRAPAPGRSAPPVVKAGAKDSKAPPASAPPKARAAPSKASPGDNPDATMMLVAPKAAPPPASAPNADATMMLAPPKASAPAKARAAPKLPEPEPANPDATMMLKPASPAPAPAGPDGTMMLAAAPRLPDRPKAAPSAPAESEAAPSVQVAKEPPRESTQPPEEAEPEEEPFDELIGINVGSYRVLKLLGRGGMGAVYLAEHPVIHSRVAIKFLHPQFSDNKKIVDRFFNEARAVNLIGHDNILKILDLNATEDGRHYFVMELLEGQALQALVEPGLPVDLSISGPILLQFCEALQAAHDRRIFHRDVKPDNVYLVQHKGRKNFVKVVDFGIAKLTEPGVSRSGTGTTQTGMVVGTPAFMSPEQAAGVHNKIDARSDIYSTGVMMFQLATGKLPFPSTNFGEVLIGHMRLEPPRPREFNPEIPLEYEQIILQALAKPQEARQQSMAELGRQIAEVMHALQISRELPVADSTGSSRDMVRLQQDEPRFGRKKAERPRFREAEVAKKQTGPLKKSGQTLATRLAPAPTAIQENPNRPAPLPAATTPLHYLAYGLGGVVLLAVVITASIYLFGSADPRKRAHHRAAAAATDTAASDEPIGPTLLSVVSEPLGATVAATWKDGNKTGNTPLDIRVPRDTKVTLVFTLNGFSPYRQDVIADESQVVTAQMQKDGSGHLQVTHRPRKPSNADEVIDVEDQLK